MTRLEQRGAARVFFIAFLSTAGSCSQSDRKTTTERKWVVN